VDLAEAIATGTSARLDRQAARRAVLPDSTPAQSDEFPSEIMKDPTHCYAQGCQVDNDIVLHVAENGYVDLCWDHASEVFAGTPLCWTCSCTFCEQARAALRAHEHDECGTLLCPLCDGVWDLTTASGAVYTLDLGAKTVTSRPGVTANDDALADPSRPLRRDNETLPLRNFTPVRLGAVTALTIGQVDAYEGYLSTTRVTTAVVKVERVDESVE
jgi:hypothetical protein